MRRRSGWLDRQVIGALANARRDVQVEARLGAVEVVMDAYRRGALERAVVYDVADEAGKNLRDCLLDANGKVG